jgi:hypothetical protein
MPTRNPSIGVGICEDEISQPFEISSLLAEMLELINYFTKLTRARPIRAEGPSAAGHSFYEPEPGFSLK